MLEMDRHCSKIRLDHLAMKTRKSQDDTELAIFSFDSHCEVLKSYLTTKLSREQVTQRIGRRLERQLDFRMNALPVSGNPYFRPPAFVIIFDCNIMNY